jgi:L1 cell adhesion molecule like protein
MVKRDNSPAVLDEVKAELDPIIEEGIKWLEENDKAETDVYKEKQKELEAKVNPLMQKLYSQGGGMPSGMPTGDDGEADGDETDETEVNGTTGTKPTIDELD